MADERAGQVEADHRHRHHSHRHGDAEYDESPLRQMANGAVLALFVLLLMVAPVPLGANRDWAWSPIVVAIGALAALAAMVSGSRGGFDVAPQERKPLVCLLAAFGVFLAIALLQMSPLAPLAGSARYYQRARELLGAAHAPVPSIAIDESYYVLLRCLACGLVFLTARSIFRGQAQARFLLVGLIVSAVMVAAYGFYMQVTTHGCYVFGLLKKEGEYKPLFDRCLMSGTFVGPNNFACYLGMGVVAALALLFGDPAGEGHRHRHHRRHRLHEFDHEEESGRRWLTGTNLGLVAAAVVCMGGALISGSRAAFGSTIAGAVILGLLLIRGRADSGKALRRMVAGGVLAGLIIGAIAGGSLLRKFSVSEQNYNRVLIWKVSLDAVAHSPWLGWGLGSYTDVWPLFQRPELTQPNDKAHSTPIHVLVEMGVPGGIVAMLLALIPWLACLRGALRRHDRWLPAAAFAVVTVPVLHSLLDFSLQIPAIAFMTCALLGLGWAHTFPYSPEEEDRAFTPDA